MLRSSIIALALFAAGAAAAQEHPVKVSPADAAGPVFKRAGAQTEANGNLDFLMLGSTDKTFTSGVYNAPKKHSFKTDGYPVDEFMYFFKGGVTLTSADGTVTKIGPGDAVTLAKGWKGTWESDGYSKFYAIYDDK
ncbi:cupin domain-containing protein [Phenylobacterium sp.]|jgi:uncharacterized cupin superfamily protein|uniref:cupin domain-containing protein n=1 Tax=Phenylobacterium sp. TaxID=1871053 RepID=UPI003784588D